MNQLHPLVPLNPHNLIIAHQPPRSPNPRVQDYAPPLTSVHLRYPHHLRRTVRLHCPTSQVLRRILKFLVHKTPYHNRAVNLSLIQGDSRQQRGRRGRRGMLRSLPRWSTRTSCFTCLILVAPFQSVFVFDRLAIDWFMRFRSNRGWWDRQKLNFDRTSNWIRILPWLDCNKITPPPNVITVKLKRDFNHGL